MRAGNLTYYASIMLDAFSCLLCPKLCWHNWHKPTHHIYSLLHTRSTYKAVKHSWHAQGYQKIEVRIQHLSIDSCLYYAQIMVHKFNISFSLSYLNYKIFTCLWVPAVFLVPLQHMKSQVTTQVRCSLLSLDILNFNTILKS